MTPDLEEHIFDFNIASDHKSRDIASGHNLVNSLHLASTGLRAKHDWNEWRDCLQRKPQKARREYLLVGFYTMLSLHQLDQHGGQLL